MISALINGLGAGILWTAKNAYISSCTSMEARGFHFAYFYLILMLAFIFGNIISTFILYDYAEETQYITMTFLCFISCAIFLSLGKPKSLLKRDNANLNAMRMQANQNNNGLLMMN